MSLVFTLPCILPMVGRPQESGFARRFPSREERISPSSARSIFWAWFPPFRKKAPSRGSIWSLSWNMTFSLDWRKARFWFWTMRGAITEAGLRRSSKRQAVLSSTFLPTRPISIRLNLPGHGSSASFVKLALAMSLRASRRYNRLSHLCHQGSENPGSGKQGFNVKAIGYNQKII